MAAAGILLLGPRGRSLFCRRADSGLWSVPAGHIEPGEGAFHAARRELREETGYAGPLGEWALLLRLRHFWLFSAEVPREFVPRLDAEHTAAVWASPHAPPQPIHPGLWPVLPRR